MSSDLDLGVIGRHPTTAHRLRDPWGNHRRTLCGFPKVIGGRLSTIPRAVDPDEVYGLRRCRRCFTEETPTDG